MKVTQLVKWGIAKQVYKVIPSMLEVEPTAEYYSLVGNNVVLYCREDLPIDIEEDY